MKIAVNVRFLIKDKLEGIGKFTYETLKIITLKHPEHEFFFLFDRPFDKEFIFSENITPIVVSPQARHPLLWYVWFEFSLPHLLKKINADIFISPDGYLSLNAKIKSLAVFHDIAFEHYPNDIPWLVNKYYHYYFPKFAAKADKIVTVSEYSKRDIMAHYAVPGEKIDVVFNGSSLIFRPSDQSNKTQTKNHLTGGEEYFVYAGAIHSRKNIVNLLKSYDKFREISGRKLKLVLIGRKAWQNEELEKTFEKMKFKKDVIFTGRVSDEDLVNYIGAAYAMVYISYFEGFGIPPLEAMYCDVPVIVSDRTSLPEIVGDAGLKVDPFNIDEIASTMKTLAENEHLHSELILKAATVRKRFSWDKTAGLLWDSIVETANE